MDPIAPVTGLIDKAEELIGHSPHTAIVSLPIGALAVSNVSDGLAVLTGDRRFDAAARVSMAVGLVGAAGAVVTGLRDYSFIDKDKPSHEVATSHGLGNALVGSLFAASYILRARDHARGRRPGFLARAFGLAGGGLMLYTAWLGGVLVSDYGESVKPVMEHQDDEERHDDSARGRERLSAHSPLGREHH